MLASLSKEFPGVSIFGGSAADNTVEGNWKIFSYDDDDDDDNSSSSSSSSSTKPFGIGVSILALAPDVKLGASLVPPYAATVDKAIVTEADGRLLKTLDGKPAADVLRAWVGDGRLDKVGNVVVECASFPIGIEKVAGQYVGIHAAEITAEGYVGLFAEVNKGETLCKLTPMDDAIDSVGAAQKGLNAAYGNALENGMMDEARTKAGLLVYCGGLSIAVGERLGESLEVMQNKTAVIGMTAFGEQGCMKGRNVHSNLAVGIALFG